MDGTGATILEVMRTFLDLVDVNVARGVRVVLHGINLRVEAGEQIAVLGPNGCGKSTLIKTMTCECYPLAQEGTRVSIFGRERWDLTELKRRLGVVSDELPGRPTLRTTGRDAVLTGFFSSSTLWPNLRVTAEMRARAEEVLELVGAVGIAEKLVGEMSAGEQRRGLWWGRGRRCCCWMSRRMRWTWRRSRGCARCCGGWPSKERGFC